MLTFWLVATVLCAITLLVVLLPVFRPVDMDGEEEGGKENPDVLIYKNQLEELKRDLAAGAINEKEAGSAKAEISRRLLGAAELSDEGSSGRENRLSKRQRLLVAVFAALLLPILGTALYLDNGTPAYEAQPWAGTESEAEKWAGIGRVHMQSEKYEQAKKSFGQAIGLNDTKAEYFEMYGEAILFAGAGEISPAAAVAFQRAVELDPRLERSRYILAEWVYRSGRQEDGVRLFIDLLEQTEDAAFRVYLDQRIKSAIAEIEDLIANEDTQQNQSETAPQPLGLSEENLARVNGMVASLAARLEDDPDDLAGWLRLIRSYSVLGRTEEAAQALQTSTFTFLAKPESLQEILALADELEISRGPILPPGTEGLEVDP